MDTPRIGDRLTAPSVPPGDDAVRDWVGADAFSLWSELQSWIGSRYPGIFAPDWIYGGKKHGWALRYKKSRAFCTLLPEYRNFAVVIVLGQAERAKFETARNNFSATLRACHDAAETFHDGKWLKIDVTSAGDLKDVTDLLLLKRPGRNTTG